MADLPAASHAKRVADAGLGLREEGGVIDVVDGEWRAALMAWATRASSESTNKNPDERRTCCVTPVAVVLGRVFGATAKVGYVGIPNITDLTFHSLGDK